MAIYRQVHISFWQDSWVEDLSSEEKYFYLYLLTNSQTKQCGCYEIGKKIMMFETGLTPKKIDQHLKTFVKERKIDYNPATKEVLMRNWLKFNSFKSPKVKTCILKELEEIKYQPFKDYILAFMEGNGADDMLIEYDLEPEEEDTPEPAGDPEFTKDFLLFWSIYPRKEGKLSAYKKFNIAKKKMSSEDILKATKNYAEECVLNSTEKRYIKLPATFLGPDMWYKEWVNRRPTKGKSAGKKSGEYQPSNHYKPLGGDSKKDDDRK